MPQRLFGGWVVPLQLSCLPFGYFSRPRCGMGDAAGDRDYLSVMALTHNHTLIDPQHSDAQEKVDTHLRALSPAGFDPAISRYLYEPGAVPLGHSDLMLDFSRSNPPILWVLVRL